MPTTLPQGFRRVPAGVVDGVQLFLAVPTKPADEAPATDAAPAHDVLPYRITGHVNGYALDAVDNVQLWAGCFTGALAEVAAGRRNVVLTANAGAVLAQTRDETLQLAVAGEGLTFTARPYDTPANQQIVYALLAGPCGVSLGGARHIDDRRVVKIALSEIRLGCSTLENAAAWAERLP